MNNYKWTGEQRYRIVEIDREERKRGKYSMKRLKERLETEFPTVVGTPQNLTDNTKRFRKEGWVKPLIENNEVATAQIPSKSLRNKTS